MIHINNLTKIYKSKKKIQHKALDNINLTLPNHGLVFVIGKSGSGKSTLLNLLGGLDNITSGNIIIDGNDITKFNERELSNYRNNHIGFIFQDYHLLDELTVHENIVLSLKLNRIEDNDKVKEALEKVGLSGYENRYPSELSGGERQRVAIARAIVKKPYIILADEPTGNLDNETGTQIIDLLKTLSSECLILIVSHNTIDTYKYADRVIKLSKGNIISDESKNPEYIDEIKYENNTIYYPVDKNVTDSDIEFINKRINDSNINKVEGIKDKYITTANVIDDERNIVINKNNLSIKEIFKLCFTFLRTKVFRIAISSFMVAVIMVILALAETIITFNSGEILSNEMDKINQTSLFMEKFPSKSELEQMDKKVFAQVTQEDINTFKNNGYDGNIYEVLNITLPIQTAANSAGWQNSIFDKSIYINETLGTILADEDFLVSKFGEIEFVARLDEFKSSGIFITDYVADAIKYHKSLGNIKSDNDILGEYKYVLSNLNLNRGYINGIIKTDYSTKYKPLIEKFYNKSVNINDILGDELFQQLSADVYSKLGYSYAIDENYVENFIKDDVFQSTWTYGLKFDDKIYNSYSSPQVWRGKTKGYSLDDNSVWMNFQKYNEIFGTEYTSTNLNTFKPHTVKLEQYYYDDFEQKNLLMSIEITIEKLVNTGHYIFIAGDNVYSKFKNNLAYTKGLYFDSNENLNAVLEVAAELNYEQRLLFVEGIHTMTKAVDVFIPIFELVAIVLCVGIIFILISFSTKMVRDKMHDIGILKALGCKNSTIGIIFGLQLLLIALCTIILSTIGYFFFIDLANDVLIESLKILAPGHIVIDLDFLTFKMSIVGVNSVLVIILCIISFIIPMVKIYNIKPVLIIKTKE